MFLYKIDYSNFSYISILVYASLSCYIYKYSSTKLAEE